MSPDELYAFDLNGYLVIEDAIDPQLLDELSPVVDAWEQASALNDEKRNAKIPRIILEQPLFLEVAMSPAVIARVVKCIQFPRLKSTWLDFKAQNGGIGYHANHTPYDPVDAYYWQGHIYANLITVCYALCDIPEDGAALDVIPGSHKANYPLPTDPVTLKGLRKKLPLRKGSALIFSHDMNHGSQNNRDYVRRCLFTSFSTGSSAHTHGDAELYDDLFHDAEEGSWRKYLLRRPKGDRDSYPQPTHSIFDRCSQIPS